ncbi:MAG: hypothetical protein AB8I08_02225 [Sandaracinaceae bacterium]
MSAREQITNLTLLWILYGAATSALSLFSNGIGLWSVALTGVSFLIGLGLNVLIGRALVNRNNIVRYLVSGLAAVTLCFGVFAAGKIGLLFFGTWSFRLLIPLAMLVPMLAMNAHSLRVLFSSKMRRYFA